jgi:hypothetical protein
MEGLGVAASVITVVTIALQSVQFISDTVSQIKDGPHSVNRLTAACSDLKQLFDIVEETAKRSEHILGATDSAFLNDVRPLLEKCVADLESINNTLSRLELPSGARFRDKVTVNAKSYVHAKDLERMWSTVHRYVQLLETRLSHIEV